MQTLQNEAPSIVSTVFELHPKQKEIYNDKHRFQIAECGRRFGKTQLAWVKCLTYMIQNPHCLLWWVAPLYKELRPATVTVRKITPKEWIIKKTENNETISYIKLFNGSECFFHSADREDSLRGSGLNGLVIDEAPLLKETRWSSELEPSLIDYDGWAFFIGTPKGRNNWFARLKAKGDDPLNPTYRSWRLDSYWNAMDKGGFLNRSSIDSIADDLPEMIRRQEIYAEELEGAGVVFRNINRQIKQITPYVQGEEVVCGADFGKTVDYTVNIAVRLNGEIIGFDRYNEIDWHFQRERTVAFARRFGNPRLIIDSTGLGDPIFDEMEREYSNVEGFVISGSSKAPLIENLSLMLDDGKIWFDGNPVTHEFNTRLHYQFPLLKTELETYSYDITHTGHIQYNAPEGYHDDCVIALALAAYQAKPIHELDICRGSSKL